MALQGQGCKLVTFWRISQFLIQNRSFVSKWKVSCLDAVIDRCITRHVFRVKALVSSGLSKMAFMVTCDVGNVLKSDSWLTDASQITSTIFAGYNNGVIGLYSVFFSVTFEKSKRENTEKSTFTLKT